MLKQDGKVPVWVCQSIWAAIFIIELAWCFLRAAG